MTFSGCPGEAEPLNSSARTETRISFPPVRGQGRADWDLATVPGRSAGSKRNHIQPAGEEG